MSFVNKFIKKLQFNRNDNTRFKLILRNWGGVSDINILSRALQTETYRSYIKHKIYEPKKNHNYLVLAPHQDDELIGAGGLMLKAADKGAKIAICYVTNGAQNNLVLSGKKYSPQEVSETRRREARSVCKGLGAECYELGIDNISMHVGEEHVDKLLEIIKHLKPDIILSPWIFDGSAKHRIINHLLYLALKKHASTNSADVWGYQVNNPIFSNIAVDITEQRSKRNRLLNLYKSQNIGIKNYTHLAEGLSAWNSRYLPSKMAQGERKYAELFMTKSCSEFLGLIEKYYLPNIQETYFGAVKIAQTMKNL